MDENERKKGMDQGIWLAVQELAHDGRWTQAAEELVSSCGLTEDECRKLQEESESFNDEMIKFIDNFENYIYDCVKSGCLGCEREDGESVRYTIVNT